MTASARIQAELADFADLTRAAQELLSVVDSLETVQKLQPLLQPKQVARWRKLKQPKRMNERWKAVMVCNAVVAY